MQEEIKMPEEFEFEGNGESERWYLGYRYVQPMGVVGLIIRHEIPLNAMAKTEEEATAEAKKTLEEEEWKWLRSQDELAFHLVHRIPVRL